MMRLWLCLLFLGVQLTECRSHSPLTRRVWGLAQRGGAGTPSVSVGLVGSNNNGPSAIFYHHGTKYTSLPSDNLSEDAIETLAVTSDVLVLTITQQLDSTSMVVDQIVQGANRRRDAGYAKLAVLVLLLDDTLSAEEMASWKDRIVATSLGALTPSSIASLDVVCSKSEAESTYQDVISDLQKDDNDRMANTPQEYQALFQQIYESLNNNNSKSSCHFVLEAAAEEDSLLLFDGVSSSNRNNVLASPKGKASEENDKETTTTPDEAAAPTIVEQETSNQVDVTAPATVDQQLLLEAMEELEKLENQQEEVWLNADSQVPLLHFGSSANSILNKADKALSTTTNDRDAILAKIAGKLRELYQNQLQSLREHYGRKYEAALEEHAEDEQALTEAAARITEGFRAAAQHAIPEKCREGQELVDAGDFTYVNALQGLVSDMMEITTMVKDIYDQLEDEDDDDEQVEQKQPAKWYKKLAARALMLGINYGQGWLAWQGVRKAAAQRDKDMPKFPLF